MFLIYIDILGFKSLPHELSAETKIDPNYIREYFLLNPTREKIYEVFDSTEVNVLTDNFFIATHDINKVFLIIEEITRLRIPHINPRSIPFEIALGKKDLSDNWKPISQNETIDFLSTNLLESYRSYYRLSKGESPKETFILFTKEFYEQLSNDRRLLCDKLCHEKLDFYVANVQMMSDIDGTRTNDLIMIRKFKSKIQKEPIWKYFELKCFLFRDPSTDKWLFRFINLSLLENEIQPSNDVRTDHLSLIHRIYQIELLDGFLDRLTAENFEIEPGLIGSLDLINEKMEYMFWGYVNGYRMDTLAEDFGLNRPCYNLLKGGKSLRSTREIERIIESELLFHEPPYDSLTAIKDAIIHSLQLRNWTPSDAPFLLISAPVPLAIPEIRFNNDLLSIKISCSDAINPSCVTANVSGRHENDPTEILPTTVFTRINQDYISCNIQALQMGEQTDAAKINLYYLAEKFDDRYVMRSVN